MLVHRVAVIVGVSAYVFAQFLIMVPTTMGLDVNVRILESFAKHVAPKNRGCSARSLRRRA